MLKMIAAVLVLTLGAAAITQLPPFLSQGMYGTILFLVFILLIAALLFGRWRQ